MWTGRRLKQSEVTCAYKDVAGKVRYVFYVFGCPEESLGCAFSVEIDYAGLEYALCDPRD